MECVPFETSAIERYQTKTQWDAEAVDIVATMLERWHLTALSAFVGGEAASVLTVRTAAGDIAVLKVGYPHVESVWEAVALEAWSPARAPRVLRQDAWTWSMLLEQVEPGIPLSQASVSTPVRLKAAGQLYTALGGVEPVPGIPRLRQIVDTYVRDARARLPAQRVALDRLGIADLIETGLGMCTSLARADGGSRMLHGDFNPGNVLLRGATWVVIDPSPMLGDPEFDMFPLIEQLGSPLTARDPVAALTESLGIVTETVGCAPDTTARWAFARAALNVCWALHDNDLAVAAQGAQELRVWQRVSGL